VIRTVIPPRWRARYDTTDHILVRRAGSRAWSETIFTDTAGIWLHVRGRYPLGCVAPGAEYEAVRTEIESGLRELHDEAGRRVFQLVARREDLYRGPYVSEAPDLVAVCDQRFGLLFESLRRDLRARHLFGTFDEEGYTGSHDPLGIYVLAGPPVGAFGAHREYPIESIAPTVLHLLGLPVPRSMEGPVCTTALEEHFRNRNPVRFSDEPDDQAGPPPGWAEAEDEARVGDHLRALGYLE
jgi:predicted AlkP superfamily phosphohydrolase/phosphomutase